MARRTQVTFIKPKVGRPKSSKNALKLADLPLEQKLGFQLTREDPLIILANPEARAYSKGIGQGFFLCILAQIAVVLLLFMSSVIFKGIGG